MSLPKEGNKYPKATLASAWPRIFEIYLDEDQTAFMQAVVQISQEIYADLVCVRDLTGRQVFETLNWNWDQEGFLKCLLLVRQLTTTGLITSDIRVGDHVQLLPTYVGFVRLTREAETEAAKLLKQLLEEWETTNVDFTRELNLRNDKEKAEFIRDVLGLATTQSSGRRFLVVGFDNETREFHTSVDPAITQERLEQILTAYCEPDPRIRYETVPWDAGRVGVIELFRDSSAIPYKVQKNFGRLSAGDIYVRHGSHTEPPTPRERDELLAEGAKATPS